MDLLSAHYKIEELGIPILGVYEDGRIDFAPEATLQQKEQATSLLLGLVDKPVEQKTTNEVSVEIAALTGEQRDTLINLMLAQFLVDQPHLAEKLDLPVKAEKESTGEIDAPLEIKK